MSHRLSVFLLVFFVQPFSAALPLFFLSFSSSSSSSSSLSLSFSPLLPPLHPLPSLSHSLFFGRISRSRFAVLFSAASCVSSFFSLSPAYLPIVILLRTFYRLTGCVDLLFLVCIPILTSKCTCCASFPIPIPSRHLHARTSLCVHQSYLSPAPVPIE